MPMGRRTINSIGAIAAVGIVAGVYFGVAAPILSQRAATETELQQAQTLGEGYQTKLQNFRSGISDEAQEAQNTAELFQSLVSESIDIESASRAIAAALPPGVKLDSFNFGAAQQVATLASEPLTISGYTAPAEFGGEDAAATGGEATAVDPSAPISGFNRIPFTIKVTAGSYDELADYLNSLAEQPRLMSVVSIDTSRAETVSATVYAFAFAGR